MIPLKPMMLGLWTRSRRSFYRVAVAAAVCLLLSAAGAQAAAGQQATAGAPPAPSQCLLAGRIADPADLLQRLARPLRAADGRTEAADLAQALAARMGLPDATCLDLSQPVDFLYLTPAKHADPWVFRFRTTDAARLREALAGSHSLVCERGTLVTATRNPDAAPGELWAAVERSALSAPRRGQLSVRADVQGLLQVFDADVERQIQLMKERMEATLHRPFVPEATAGETAEFQAQLDRAFLIARQVDRAEMWVDLTDERALLGVHASPLQGSLLSVLLGLQPRGSLDALRRCPDDAIIALLHRFRVGRQLLRAPLDRLRQVLGTSEAPEEPAAEVLAALPRPGDGRRVQLLLQSTGSNPGRPARLWEALANTPTSAHPLPLTLEPIEPEDRTMSGVRTADVLPHDNWAAIFGGLLGEGAKAALDAGEERSTLLVGAQPLRRVRQIRALGNGGDFSLRDEARFSASLEGIPERPQALLYVAPEGLERWFALAGVPAQAIAPVPRGVTAAVHVSSVEGVHAAVTVPLGPVSRALGHQRLNAP